ncbi:MAG: 2Fe-2S iron-sulfur cluster-binding protein [Bdellovibrio sp.]
MNAKPGKCITFLPNNKDVPVSHKDNTLLDFALRLGISLDHTCGGNGTCGTCLIRVVEGGEKLEARNELESEIAQDRGFEADERLACQLTLVDGLVVRK